MSAAAETVLPSASPTHQAYERLRAAYRINPYPNRAQREDWLERLETMIRSNQEVFVDAINADFMAARATRRCWPTCW